MSRSWSQRPGRRPYPPRPRSSWRRFFDYALAILFLGLVALIVARFDRVSTRQENGTAIVNDGDTITLGKERIRLRGIDAPEYSQLCRKDGLNYPCGKLSRQALVKLIGGRAVSCSGWQRDRYDRLLGDCKVGNVDLNAEQVRAGWAVAFGDFDVEEAAARVARAGIWAGSFDEPRDWRRSHDGATEPRHGTLASVGDTLRELFRLR
ncbi:thermonuclease family protein [Mesorhizobium sp. UC22_110]|uniref:thermonuclease family protein n=1 Tax=unclassified Mesorhizobium TaxID=325217 RepID=UPI00366F5EAB